MSQMQRITFILTWALIGGAVGAGIKSIGFPRGQPAASTLPQGVRGAELDPTSGHSPPTAKPDPAAQALPRPALEELRAAAQEVRLTLLVRWLPEATAQEVAALAAEWFQASIDTGTPEWQALAVRWVELDPAAAVAFGRLSTSRLLKNLGPRGSSDGLTTPLTHVYRALGRIDPDTALAWLAREEPRLQKYLVRDVIAMVGEEKARAWARSRPEMKELAFLRDEKRKSDAPDLSDPAKAAAALGPNQSLYHARDIATAWAEKNPEAALAWARGLTNPQQRAAALQSVMFALLKKDPGLARPLLDEMPQSMARAQAEASYTAALAEKDPEAALRHARENLHGTARLAAIAAVASARSRTDPLGALALLREYRIGDMDRGKLDRTHVDGPGGRSVGNRYVDHVPAVLKAASALDPAGVMQLLSNTGSIQRVESPASLDDRGGLASGIFAEWASRDVVSATQWLARQPAHAGTMALAETVAERWHQQDGDGLRRFVAQLPEGPTRQQLVEETARRMVGQDAAMALQWATQVGGEAAMAATFKHLAEINPQVAAERFATGLDPGQQAAQSQHLTDQLARRAPAEAVEFFHSLPADQQASIKLYETTIAYARQDPRGASEWIGGLPSTNAKDSAISGLVDYLIKESADPDPLAAAQWAAASIDPDGRERRLQRVAEAWFRGNPAGARAAIEAAALPPDVRQTLLSHEPAAR